MPWSLHFQPCLRWVLLACRGGAMSVSKSFHFFVWWFVPFCWQPSVCSLYYFFMFFHDFIFVSKAFENVLRGFENLAGSVPFRHSNSSVQINRPQNKKALKKRRKKCVGKRAYSLDNLSRVSTSSFWLAYEVIGAGAFGVLPVASCYERSTSRWSRVKLRFELLST